MRLGIRPTRLYSYSMLLGAAFTLSVGSDTKHCMSLVQLRAEFSSNVSSATKPHIVFVLSDDLGWNGVGYNAGEKSVVKTPFLDQLAADGVKMAAYYVGAYCAPSRFALLTGREPWRSEAGYENFRADNPIGTNLAYELLPAALKKAGYDTHLIGKWHLGFHMDAYLPTSRGFDTAYGIMESCTYHFTQQVFHADHLNCKIDGHDMRDMMENGAPDTNYTEGDLSDDLYRDRAVRLIKSHNQSRSLFLYLALQLPHEPYEVTTEYSAKYSFTGELAEKQNTYWGMHSHVDDTVKAVVDALHGAMMYENTLLIFASDNGATTQRMKKPYSANFPFRGHKGQLYDGGIHVPCFVSGGFLPKSAKGRSLGGLMSVSDWYATLAEVSSATLSNAGPAAHDSKNNWNYIIGTAKESSRSEVINHHVGVMGQQSMIRQGKYKAIVFGKECERDAEDSLCRTDDPRHCTPEEPCLYDVEADPGESNDIAASEPELVKTFAARMESSFQLALQQEFFGTPQPNDNLPTIRKACDTFQKSGGYLTPWATHEDEVDFEHRALMTKTPREWQYKD